MNKTNPNSESNQSTDNSEDNKRTYDTFRVIAPGLEALLYDQLNVLDHGFIRVIDYMGNDTSIVQAARVSYGTGTKKISEDANLIRYLMRNRHSTPFEMCEIKLHIKLPIFIARQWIRHRTANINEYSARYSILNKEFYIPDPEIIASQSTTNNQGRDQILSLQQAQQVREILINDALQTYDNYEKLLTPDDENDFPGVSRELARINLTLNYYTEWYWKIDLHNFLHFLSLRNHDHAQYEIREYAKIMSYQILKSWLPITYQAFLDYKQNSLFMSAEALKMIKDILPPASKVDPKKYNLSARELKTYQEILGFEIE